MRTLYVYFLFLFLTVALCLPSRSTGKEKLAVMDLTAKYGVKEGLSEALSVIIRDEIHRAGDFEIVSKEDIKTIAERTAITLKFGSEDTKSLINIGRTLGTKYMVAGAISKFGDTYYMSLRLIDTTGDDAGVKERVNRSCKCAEDELIYTAAAIARQVMKREGFPVASSDPRQVRDEREKLQQKKQLPNQARVLDLWIKEKLGLTVQAITPELIERFNLSDPKGVIVTEVKPGSQAQKAGFQTRDIIREVDRKKIESLDDYREAMKGFGKESLFLWVQRGNQSFFLILKLWSKVI